MARETRCLAELELQEEAVALSEGVTLYPEFTLLWVTRARLGPTRARSSLSTGMGCGTN